ncbi:hypothetical protein BDZ45DRAFT_809121 [Acephala macrosclerotiorum]|nr:hypothetical protein BDZ45DRAFT_809121 [Acephala macrosclerotiorum]
MRYLLAIVPLVGLATAFPFSGSYQPGGPETCPFNPNHEYPVPVNDKFQYNGAKGGKPSRRQGGYLVPDPEDLDHQFIAPTDQDIRGLCPGLNAAPNRGNIHLINDACRLANLSIVVADGDVLITKVSIDCNTTTRTANPLSIQGSEPGLDGHNKFEGDVSSTRDGYFLGKGDNFSFNGTLFGMMAETTNGTF